MTFLENIPLDWGSSGKLLIREEALPLFCSEGQPYRIFYASDIHLQEGDPRGLIGQLVEAAGKARPDLILFGGDLVDQPNALSALTECVRELSSFAPLAAVGGNHDQGVGVRLVQKALEKGRGFWLGRESLYFKAAGQKIRVDGRLKPVEADGMPRLLCAHFPDFFPRAARQGYKLVLAGHLHGCQWVFWKSQEKLYPGAWFYRWNGLRFQDGPCRLLVSRGVSDSFPLRWNCPREVLLCKVY